MESSTKRKAVGNDDTAIQTGGRTHRGVQRERRISVFRRYHAGGMGGTDGLSFPIYGNFAQTAHFSLAIFQKIIYNGYSKICALAYGI